MQKICFRVSSKQVEMSSLCCMQSGVQEPTEKLMRDEIMTMLFAGENLNYSALCLARQQKAVLGP